MSIGGVGELFLATLGIGDEDGQAQCVVFVGGAATQGVGLLDEVAALIVVTLPDAALGVTNGDQLVVVVVLVSGLAPVRLGAGQEVVVGVKGAAADAAIGVHVLGDVFTAVAMEPFF